MLTVDNTATYLLDLGLVPVEAILSGDLCVTTATRRNPNIVVTHSGEGPSFLIKQVDAAVNGADLSIGLEGAFYRFAAGSPGSDLRSIMTSLVMSDEPNRRLLIAFVRDAVTLWRHIRRFPPADMPLDAFGALGRALATLHGAPIDDAGRAAFAGHLRSDLRAHKPTPDLVATLSQANFEILRTVQTCPDLFRRLDALGASWQPTALIHGDIKAENILVVGDPAAGGAAVKLVDWELVQMGDPAWDLAGVLQDLVLFWINTMSPAESVDAMVQSAVWPWHAVQPAFAALVRCYARHSRLGAAAFNLLLLKAVRFCGARLVQTAFEMAQMSNTLPIPSVLLVQLGENILADPQIAQLRLFRLQSRLEDAA